MFSIRKKLFIKASLGYNSLDIIFPNNLKIYIAMLFSYKQPKRLGSFLFWVTIFYALDQFTKSFIRTSLALQNQRVVYDWLNWVLTWNKGLSFGLFSQSAFVQKALLVLPLCIVIGFIIRYFGNASSAINRWSTMLIVGGAFGNIKDRLHYGGVFDFIDLHWGIYHFPAFNVADVFISCGVLMILWDTLGSNKKQGGFKYGSPQ
jgi:signal peptidase II